MEGHDNTCVREEEQDEELFDIEKEAKEANRKILWVMSSVILVIVLVLMSWTVYRYHRLYKANSLDFSMSDDIVQLVNTRDSDHWTFPTKYFGKQVTSITIYDSNVSSIDLDTPFNALNFYHFPNVEELHISNDISLVCIDDFSKLKNINAECDDIYLKDCLSIDQLISTGEGIDVENCKADYAQVSVDSSVYIYDSMIDELYIEGTGEKCIINISDSTISSLTLSGVFMSIEIKDTSVNIYVEKNSVIESLLKENGYSYQYE